MVVEISYWMAAVSAFIIPGYAIIHEKYEQKEAMQTLLCNTLFLKYALAACIVFGVLMAWIAAALS